MKKVPLKARIDIDRMTMKTFISLMTSIIVLMRCPNVLKILKKYKNLNQMKNDATALRYLCQ